MVNRNIPPTLSSASKLRRSADTSNIVFHNFIFRASQSAVLTILFLRAGIFFFFPSFQRACAAMSEWNLFHFICELRNDRLRMWLVRPCNQRKVSLRPWVTQFTNSSAAPTGAFPQLSSLAFRLSVQKYRSLYKSNRVIVLNLLVVCVLRLFSFPQSFAFGNYRASHM